MTFHVEIMGFDFVADVDYTVTSYGTCDSWYEPGDPCEFEVNSIVLYRDEPLTVEERKSGFIKTPQFEATGALFQVIEELLSEKIAEQIYEDGPPDYDDY